MDFLQRKKAIGRQVTQTCLPWHDHVHHVEERTPGRDRHHGHTGSAVLGADGVGSITQVATKSTTDAIAHGADGSDQAAHAVADGQVLEVPEGGQFPVTVTRAKEYGTSRYCVHAAILYGRVAGSIFQYNAL